MYSKMLRQFSKGSLISISSESSKIHLLIKVLYRHIQFNLCRRYFLFHALNVSLCYQQQWNFMSQYLGLQGEIFQLCQCQYTCVRGHSHIKSSHSLYDAKFQTHPPSTLYFKMPSLPKIDVYNFRYKISVRISIKLFFILRKCINKCINQCTKNISFSIKCSYYIHALSCDHFGKLQTIIRLKC